MSDQAEISPTLPGLELFTPGMEQNALRKSVQRTIQALDEKGLIEPEHEALCQLALELADAVTAGKASRRASATAMAAGQLLDALQALPQPVALDAGAAFERWVESELSRND